MTLSLRPYQRAAIEALYDYFAGNTGNPLVVLPTGTGKSVVIGGFIREAIDMFGVDRCMFASDTPTDKLFAPIDRYLEAYHAIVADLPEADRRALFGGNANRLYRLGLDL